MEKLSARRRRRRRRRHLENEEIHKFSKIGMSEISRNVNLAEIKAPAGAT